MYASLAGPGLARMLGDRQIRIESRLEPEVAYPSGKLEAERVGGGTREDRAIHRQKQAGHAFSALEECGSRPRSQRRRLAARMLLPLAPYATSEHQVLNE